MASHLLRQSSPHLQSLRSIFPYYKATLPAVTKPPISSLTGSLPHLRSASSSVSASKQIMANAKPFLAAVENRRSIYQLSSSSPIPDARIKEVVTHTIKHVPSAFNSQTTRLVVLLKENHNHLWDTITSVYENLLPPDVFAKSKPRFDGFKAAYGTILFYEDTTRMREFQEKFKTYEDKFPQWAEHTSGMHQFALWVALEAEGLGVNLQHYNPPIDGRVGKEFGVPETWNLKAQMVFGTPEGGAKEKEFGGVEERVRFFE
ncbi:hypothetical protein MMC21_008013 [Puttea exsequens]|nr:hypothetical protein [Puttea exsequens]